MRSKLPTTARPQAAPPPHYVRALDELLMQPEAPDDLSGAASSGSSDDTFILAVISGVDPEDVEASSAAAHSPKRRRLNASRCYNCGSYSHTQPQCWRPIDAARAHAAAAEMRSARAAQGAGAGAGQDAGVRYFNMTPSEQMARTYAAARPGAVSSKLATALGEGGHWRNGCGAVDRGLWGTGWVQMFALVGVYGLYRLHSDVPFHLMPTFASPKSTACKTATQTSGPSLCLLPAPTSTAHRHSPPGMADACAPPPWLSRMVVLGVPPAYSFSSPVSGIDAALYQELRIYDGSEEAAGEAAPPTANGEEAGAAATAAAAASAPPPRSLLPAAGAAAFPGVNAPFPAGADAGKWQEALVDAYLRMSTAEALDHRKQLLAAAEAHEASAQAQQCTPSAQAQQDGEGPADVAGEGAMET